MKTVILTYVLVSFTFAFLLATAIVPVQAQQPESRTVRIHNNATGEHLGTITVMGNTAYIRNKDGEHVLTVVQNPDGSKTAFDTHGNVVAAPQVTRMTDDIVERLHWITVHGDQEQAIAVMEEAAAEIERLRGVIFRNCNCMTSSTEDAEIIKEIAAAFSSERTQP